MNAQRIHLLAPDPSLRTQKAFHFLRYPKDTEKSFNIYVIVINFVADAMYYMEIGSSLIEQLSAPTNALEEAISMNSPELIESFFDSIFEVISL